MSATAHAKLRKETRGLIATQAGPANPVERHGYKRLGQNTRFMASPAVMHFGGFSLNVVHEQKLRLVNKSDRSQRIHIVPPTTPYFRAKFENKGYVAPGMAQEITIEFAPTEWRYYYDCVRVHSDKENLLVPLHAYPVMNEVVFPKKVDFGICALAETTTRVVELECKVPIQFEYELTVKEDHPDFHIEPLKGVVPPNGSVAVEIDFTPLKLVSARTTVEVNISQFGFKPFICEIMGSAAAGLTRELALAEAEARVARTETEPELRTTLQDFSKEVKVRTHGVGSGGVDDPGLTALEEKLARNRAKLKARNEKLEKMGRKPPLPPARGAEVQGPPLEAKIDGVRIPPGLGQPSSINFILTQQKGKLKPKDLAAAIEQQNAQRARQKAAQDRLKAMQGAAARDAPGPGLTLSAMEAEERGGEAAADDGGEGAGDTIGGGVGSAASVTDGAAAAAGSAAEDAGSATGGSAAAGSAAGASSMAAEGNAAADAAENRRLREMVFLQDVSDIDKAERAREFQSQREWLGENEMTKTEVTHVRSVRLQVRNTQALAMRQEARANPTNVVKGPHAIVPTRVTVLARAPPASQPTFDTYKNDVWRMRKQVILRLREVATKLIVRRRAAERLAALRRRIADAAGGGPAAVRELVERDYRKAQTAGASAGDDDAAAKKKKGGANGEAPVSPWLEGFNMSQSVVHRVSFPLVSEAAEAGALGQAAMVPTVTPRGFQELTLFRLTDPPEESIMNYKPFPLPVVPAFQPQESARALRRGAAEESSVRRFDPSLDRRLIAAADTAGLAVPERAVSAPPPVASLAPLLPDPGIRPLLELEEITEASPDYLLQAALAKPFSLAPPQHPEWTPEVDPDARAAAGAGRGGGAGGGTNVAVRAVGPTVKNVYVRAPGEDMNGLVATVGQADSATLGMSSLRANLPLQTLSQVWQPRRERPDPDWLAPEAWTPSRMPTPLSGPVKDDELSDDSESDDEEAKDHRPLTLETALAMFADESAEADAAGEGGKEGEAGAAGSGEEGGDGDKKKNSKSAVAPTTAIPRDRARLALAAKERLVTIEAAEWLDRRLRMADATIVNPKHKFRFDAW